VFLEGPTSNGATVMGKYSHLRVTSEWYVESRISLSLLLPVHPRSRKEYICDLLKWGTWDSSYTVLHF
jgi:hypothetical protein